VEQSRLARDGQITGRGTGRTRGNVEEDTEHESSLGSEYGRPWPGGGGKSCEY
jgi:hypothetical protein